MAADKSRTALRYPEFWLNLQKLYELRLAERKAGKDIRALPTLKNREVVRA